MSNIYGIDIRDFFRRQAEPEPTNYEIVTQYFKPLTKKPDNKTKYKTIEPLKDNKYDTIGNVARKWKQLTEHHVKVDREAVKPITIEQKTNKQLIDDMIHNKPNMYNGLIYHNPEYNTKPRNKKILSAAIKYEKEPNGLPSVISTYGGSEYSEDNEGEQIRMKDELLNDINEGKTLKTLAKKDKDIVKEREDKRLEGIKKAVIEDKAQKVIQRVSRGKLGRDKFKVQKATSEVVGDIIENVTEDIIKDTAAKNIQRGGRTGLARRKIRNEFMKLSDEEKFALKVRAGNLKETREPIQKKSKSLDTALDSAFDASQAITKPQGGTTSKEVGGDSHPSMEMLINNKLLPGVIAPVTTFKGFEKTIKDSFNEGFISYQRIANIKPYIEQISKEDFIKAKELLKNKHNVNIKEPKDIYKYIIGNEKIKK